ncbi:MAG: biotin-dependent carboxyltransferase family protein [Pyrinomonadaceae bacterium]
MSLIIRKAGILTTVQDLGRFGSRSAGVNTNGPMDAAAVRTINVALGNDENAAVLEMHFPAAEIEFSDDTVFCIGGADLAPRLNEKRISTWTTQIGPSGARLAFKKKKQGNRVYLAVKGGLNIEPWLGSCSTNLSAGVGGFNGRALAAGDLLRCESTHTGGPIAIGRSFMPSGPTKSLRIVPGGEFHLLTAISEQKLLKETFQLTNDSNRMGFRLSGKPLSLLDSNELVSSATSFGTIQLLPNGQLIVLMADHQTSGGYPRIANIISADLGIAGQLGTGDSISFEAISIKDAERASDRLERDLRFLKIGVSFVEGNIR